jgi:DNA-3-methyladenine glycosylase II
MDTFNEDNFHSLCNELAKRDPLFSSILANYGYPPLWSREPGFPTLIRIILEQQVSLASANAAYLKLEAAVGIISPAAILLLSDEALKACYFSRQKINYARHLSRAVDSGELALDKLALQPDHIVRQELLKLKGVGEWTVDVYLMMALQRVDRFPLGDIALVKSMKENKQLPGDTSRETLLGISNEWKPYRTIAAFMLWHAYLVKRRRLLQETG